ncbi:uncharacterized protein LOC143149455 [Ptiloglossa arizonensis]|uniref:uncharacterized protein LOC143149455 n=1 Tax=Ptiloglossa arizonensis TaxID=3350558 RepID=UPI003FA188B5
MEQRNEKKTFRFCPVSAFRASTDPSSRYYRQLDEDPRILSDVTIDLNVTDLSVSDSLNFYETKKGLEDPLGSLDSFDEYVATERVVVGDEENVEHGVGYETYRDEDEEETECIGNVTDYPLEDGKLKRGQECRYTCFRCLKSYKRKGHLVEHQKIFCGKDKQQCCPFCVFRTYKKSNLKKHVKRMHYGDVFSRVICEKQKKNH